MSTVDHAPAIAAFAMDSRVAARPDGDFIGELQTHWPHATHEEIARGLEIAREIIDGDLAECRAAAPAQPARSEPIDRAAMVAGIAAALSGVRSLDDLPGVLTAIGERYPDLSWPAFMDAVDRAGNLWPDAEE